MLFRGGNMNRANAFSDKALRFTALVAAACVVGMIAIFFVTGVGQDPLQFVHPPEEYGALLLSRPGALRATIGLDDAFIVAYATVYVLLARAAKAP
jgi:hypothetical protein